MLTVQRTLDEVRLQMLPGDLVLYRNAKVLRDVLIARGGRSPWCHAGMLGLADGRWHVLQMLAVARRPGDTAA